MADDADRSVNRESVSWPTPEFSVHYPPLFHFIYFFSAMQHWLEFTKSITKQMKCKYPENRILIVCFSDETVTMHNVTSKEKLF